jgi:hypothetical protein
MGQRKRVNIGLIFTLDYEIHGNGNGDFKNWAHFPTSHMLDLFDIYGAKLTIMAEMGHYWAMKKYRDLFSEEIYLFESQLSNVIERGHDVQLHIHPQWIDAKYEEGKWHLDFSRKTIERLCRNYDEAYYFLKKGKEELQRILTPIKPDYKCVCFRAGYLQMQPSENIIRALEETGFISDSSVQKGTVAYDNLRVLDYSFAFSNYHPWKISAQEICNNDDTGKIYEFPILTERSLIKKILARVKRIITRSKKKGIGEVILGFMSKYSSKKQLKIKHRTSDKIKLLLSKSWDFVDFCKRDYSDLRRSLEKVRKICEKKNDFKYIPIVLIGHSKDFFFSNHLSLFLESCKNIEGIEFSTYTEAVKKYAREK